MTRSTRRPGFTLIELLVVIAIISMLMGLLMPAVQKAREAASRISCGNNLKQIGLAMHMFEQDRQALPPSRMGIGYATWAVLILPYLEQGNLYRTWDLSKTYYQQSDTARLSAVKLYFCPSRRSSSTGPTQSLSGDVPSWGGGAGTNIPGALGDYAAVVDRSGHDIPDASCPTLSGAFQAGSGLGFMNFGDGLSNSLMVGEKHVPHSKHAVGWWDCSIYNGDYHQCSSRAASRNFPLTTNPQDTGWKFGSRHMTVVQFVFADGHVERLPEMISSYTLELLGMRDDGSVIPPY